MCRTRTSRDFIGRFASLLGEAGVNIATFALGRDAEGGSAIALVGIDGEAPDEGVRANSRAAGRETGQGAEILEFLRRLIGRLDFAIANVQFPRASTDPFRAAGDAGALPKTLRAHRSPKNRTMASYLDFEKPVAELEARVEDLRALSEREDSPPIGEELAKLQAKADKALAEIYASLTPWQKTQVARHPQRPHCLDYIARPDRGFHAARRRPQIRRGRGDDRRPRALSRPGRSPLLGQEKGSDTATRLKHNFGMVKPEGYRKAVRIMELAERFGLPVLSFVDTAGAFPGVEAEERGQAEAIARATEAALVLGTPNVALVIGEGGSGGALGIAACNAVLMLEHSIYTVASPEASASILWRDASARRTPRPT